MTDIKQQTEQTNSSCDTQGCSQCDQQKAPYMCGHCSGHLCKGCVQFLPDNAFQYMSTRPAGLDHSCYCNSCYSQFVMTALESYEQTLARAQEILVFDKSQSKETRLIKRLEKPLIIQQGLDEHDITLRLAFLAAEKNYNAIIDVDIKATKVRQGAYQTTSYSGKAIPANVSDHKLIKDRSLWSNPN